MYYFVKKFNVYLENNTRSVNVYNNIILSKNTLLKTVYFGSQIMLQLFLFSNSDQI